MVHPLPEINHQQLVQQHAKRKQQKNEYSNCGWAKINSYMWPDLVTIKQDENITIHIQLIGKNSGPEQSQDIYKLFKAQNHEAISKVKLNLAKCECPYWLNKLGKVQTNFL